MQGETKESWTQLCEQAATEQDSQKLIKLLDEIFHLLEEKRSRVSKKEADEKGHAPYYEQVFGMSR